ncbi:hypothetical protein GCM10018773_56140 [Streptomyces candidus]|nr:hypothetical protein GCM10018773_56140 [Streptomyces candidus]
MPPVTVAVTRSCPFAGAEGEGGVVPDGGGVPGGEGGAGEGAVGDAVGVRGGSFPPGSVDPVAPVELPSPVGLLVPVGPFPLPHPAISIPLRTVATTVLAVVPARRMMLPSSAVSSAPRFDVRTTPTRSPGRRSPDARTAPERATTA